MTTRERPTTGVPCWADLWTSDVKGADRFYNELFGWQTEEPNPEFGGYFMFTRDGVPVAGGMGDMGDMSAQNLWKIYLATDDIDKTVARADAEGADIVTGAMQVGDSGIQAVLIDPTGAHFGVWQPLEFAGFTVLHEKNAPSWFELHTRDYDRALDFYRSVFGWETNAIEGMAYSTVADPDGGEEVAGVLDAAPFLPEGVPSHWSVYWEVADAAATAALAGRLGGTVVNDAEDTPYGRLATCLDPTGSEFKLRTPPA